jgi:hypothetical protein
MRLRSRSNGLASLAVVALLLPGLRVAAQTESESSEEQPEGKAKPGAPAEPVETAVPEAPPAAAPQSAPYVGLAPPPSPLRIENSSASIQFGILAQPQFEMVGAPDADLTTKNVFLRRFRLMVGGTLFNTLEFFFQTDWPDLFKLDPTGTMVFDKNAPGMNIQDAFVTYKPLAPFGERVTRWIDVKIDAGFMLPPTSHNSLESAAKLYGLDFFANSFRRNVFSIADPFRNSGESPVGRDAGAQMRLLLFRGHVDIRIGAFQGRRDGAVPASAPNPAVTGGINAPRVATRLQINLLDPEPGFFYQGTYLGARKILSLGVFYDFQKQYKYFGGDIFADLPVGPGIFTLQANAVQWDGGGYLTLPKARAYMGEVGYLIAPAMLSPILHFERLEGPLIPQDPAMPAGPQIHDPNNPSEDRYGGGLAFWPYGFNSNVKLYFLRVHRNPALHDYNQINVQWQVYVF